MQKDCTSISITAFGYSDCNELSLFQSAPRRPLPPRRRRSRSARRWPPLHQWSIKAGAWRYPSFRVYGGRCPRPCILHQGCRIHLKEVLSVLPGDDAESGFLLPQIRWSMVRSQGGGAWGDCHRQCLHWKVSGACSNQIQPDPSCVCHPIAICVLLLLCTCWLSRCLCKICLLLPGLTWPRGGRSCARNHCQKTQYEFEESWTLGQVPQGS